ncbi:serine hydrolase domain-containing protein [Glaciihabitans sp. UYNi722]|uniref:serine hydrolase domain-containing protein n=1 Tax=Glaciihabitans sp. UYNi722 TaxID=3156344 RepID=UPI003392A2F5
MDRTLEPSRPEDEGLSSEGLARIDAAIQGYIDEGRLAGAVTLVARHGRRVHRSVMGLDDIASRKPLALDTIFRIFSMTKPVTGVAMMILHDRGLWKPEDPIAKFLPELEGAKVLIGLDADGAPTVADAHHAPTMSELMTHTAGFSYGTDPQSAIDRLYGAAQVNQSGNLRELVQRIATVPLAYQPGTEWLYSLSVDIQGAIIERLTGMTLPEFFDEQIFAPLGMTDTAFFTPPEKVARRATLYSSGEGAPLTVLDNPLLPDFDAVPSMASGGAGLLSTIGDYARFAQMLLNGGEFDGARVVSAEGLKLQMANHVSDDILNGGFGVGNQRIRPGFGFGFDGAVFTDPLLAGVPVGVGTYQWDGAAGTWFWVDPENDLLFVGLVQLLSAAAPPFQLRTQQLMADAIS